MKNRGQNFLSRRVNDDVLCCRMDEIGAKRHWDSRVKGRPVECTGKMLFCFLFFVPWFLWRNFILERILSVCSTPWILAIERRQTGTIGSGFWSVNELFICHGHRDTHKIIRGSTWNFVWKISGKRVRENSELWCNAGMSIQVKLVLCKVKSLHLNSPELKVLTCILPVHPAHPGRPARLTPDLFTSPQRSFKHLCLWVYRMSCCDGNRWAERERGRLCSFVLMGWQTKHS